MRLLPIAALLLALPFSAAPTSAAGAEGEKHLLRYQFKPGETLRWQVDQRSSVRNTMQGTTQEAQTKTLSTKAWRVIDVLPSGEIEFLTLVEKVRMENKLPDRAAMVFDSTSEEKPAPGFEDAARAVGVPLSAIRMSPRGEVVDRKIKHHQDAADPHEQVVMRLPEGPIAVGESWTDPTEITVKVGESGVKPIKARRQYTLESVSAGVAIISCKFQVLSPTTPEIDAQLAHRLVKGEVRFDLDSGRILSQQLGVDRRVLGFAGPSSSMHLITQMKVELKEAPAEVASKP
ncbi:hypothetical protein MalM25_25850 [Planctomycetes bacterium MalM25]|nr:hypothetical protein MalM25_25850 [Planctomycetes bacterium MalM25]